MNYYFTSIGASTFAYIHERQHPIGILALHEHHGLSYDFVITIEKLFQSKYTLIVPDLFDSERAKNNEPENEIQRPQIDIELHTVDHQKLANIVLQSISFLHLLNKQIVIIGLSLGASIGLKMLEYVSSINLAFFFYGFPPHKQIKPHLIACPTIIFIATKDNIPKLSDRQHQNSARKMYSVNELITFVDVANSDHGFMNQASNSFSQDSYNMCQTRILFQLQEMQKRYATTQNQGIPTSKWFNPVTEGENEFKEKYQRYIEKKQSLKSGRKLPKNNIEQRKSVNKYPSENILDNAGIEQPVKQIHKQPQQSCKIY